MSNDGAFVLGLTCGQEDRENNHPIRTTLPTHLQLSLTEQASWWAGYLKGYYAKES